METIYEGTYDPVHNTYAIQVRHPDGTVTALPKCTDLMDYCQDFAWGYNGRGPRQAALALCAYLLRDGEKALKCHEKFLERFVSEKDSTDSWAASEKELHLFLRSILLEVDK